MTITLAGSTYSWIYERPAADCLLRLAELGFERSEAMIAPGHLWPSELDRGARQKLRRTLAERGLSITSLNPPSADQNLASPVAEMRVYTVAMFRELIELAADLEVPAVVTVTGRVHPLLRPAAERLRGWVKDGIERLLPVAERAGVRMLLENIPMAPLPAAAGLAAFCREWESPAIGICYDVANAHFIGEDPTLGLREVFPYLGLMHASDTGRDVWRHDRIGSGTVDFARVPQALAAVGYDGPVVLELILARPETEFPASRAALAAAGWPV
jgi:L-ribulose-5-phosphate 3-epimerase